MSLDAVKRAERAKINLAAKRARASLACPGRSCEVVKKLMFEDPVFIAAQSKTTLCRNPISRNPTANKAGNGYKLREMICRA